MAWTPLSTTRKGKIKVGVGSFKWTKAERIKVTPSEWMERHNALKADPDYSLAKTKCGLEWLEKRYLVDETNMRLELFVSDGSSQRVYVTRMDGFIDKPAGREAVKAVSEKFEELNGVGFEETFPSLDPKTQMGLITEFSRCTPKDIQIPFERFGRHRYGGQVDGCSQYPSNARGRMPSLNPSDWLEVEGWPQELPEGYDFAFSLVSGHVKERDAFDSHDILTLYPDRINDVFRVKETKNRNLMQPFYPKEKEKVLLMRSCRYNLTAVMEHFYRAKETFEHDSPEYVAAKLVMNAFIGALGPNTDYLYPGCKCRHPMRAIVLWRSAFSILRKATEIGWANILDISIDGILYSTPKPTRYYGEDDKHMGRYHQEAINQLLFYRGHNTYAFQNPDGTVGKFKHGAYDGYENRVWDDKTDRLRNIEDILKFNRSPLQREMTELRAYYRDYRAKLG